MNPPELRYTADHEWVRADSDGTVVVGITDFAQNALGDIVYVQLPEIGRKVSDHETMAEVESVKSVSEIYAPISGTVLEVNPELDTAPESINDEPYGGGWLVRLQPEDSSALDDLLDADAYSATLEAS